MKELLKRLNQYTILYVEDNYEISEEVVFFLEPIAKNVYVAYNGQEGVELYNKHKPDIIITDIQMPVMNGIDMIKNIRTINETVPIVITTAFNESSYLIEAINLGVDAYLMKPLNLKELLKSLYKIIEPMELKQEVLSKNEELIEINLNLDAIAQEKTKELKYLYSHDPLTGLYNFVSLSDELENGNYEYILLLDVSNFSLINKQYGKLFANKILKAIGVSLQENIMTQYQLFKTESDRFVFLSKEEELDKVEEFCQQIISFFDNRLLSVDGIEIEVSFSFGIAKITEKYFPLLNAEYALEKGKALGSRYYSVFDESSEEIEKSQEMIKWLAITRELIHNDYIEAYYQPIKDIQSGEIYKYEVLARGNYKGEIIAPYFFLEHAQRLGLMGALTRIIVNKSFHYFSDKTYEFSINITQRDLLDKYFVAFLESKLEKYSLNPTRVTFEILENISMDAENKLLMEKLRKLKAMGFKIAIDDFGMDNSNFARLLEIDFDYIKLDGVFIKNLVTNKKDRIIVAAIVSLAKTLGVKTVAEYVENSEIYDLIKESGVDMAQGYYIGKPSPGLVDI